MKKMFTCLLCLAWIATAGAAPRYDQYVTQLPQTYLVAMAGTAVPDASGAVGRNQAQYIHARFQWGGHYWADHAVATQSAESVRTFFRILDYAFAQQINNKASPEYGAFNLVPPPGETPGESTQASATAFFLASAASGLLALDRSDWLMNATSGTEAADLLTQVKAYKIDLRKVLNYVKSQKENLLTADQYAPNRQLITALALHTAGKFMLDEDAQAMAQVFVIAASQQQHPVNYYFIENGGWDSSYNGVSCAIGYRLWLFKPTYEVELLQRIKLAVGWQFTRVSSVAPNAGEISLEGNTRVKISGTESFLGAPKQVDAVKSIEAFLWASVINPYPPYRVTADNIASFYFP